VELEHANVVIVPGEIEQRFSDGGQSIANSIRLDWKNVNSDKSSDVPVSAKSTLDEFKATVGNIKSRVDKLLNR